MSEEISSAGGMRTFVKPQAKTREDGFDFSRALEGHKAKPPAFCIALLAISPLHRR